MTNVEQFLAALKTMECRYSFDPKFNPSWVLNRAEAPDGIAQEVSVSQVHFFFDADGKFLGTLADEMGYWEKRGAAIAGE
ncbi:MAG: hypothetical protein Q8K86_08175 [Candidatus Nanopelagicaceae bacterium]|nr:hypothetical protein [Candidatus Nanopelagicaceae bacterium]